MNILFTCAGRRKYLVDYFQQEELVEKVIGADMSNTAPALASCDAWYQVPGIYEPEYIDKIIEICKFEKIDIVISLNDMELPILAKNRERFNEIGVQPIISNDKVIEVSSDKWKTYLLCIENDIPTPISFIDLNLAIEALNHEMVKYPLIVKPRWGSASFSLQIVNTNKELTAAFIKCKQDINESYLSRFKESDKDVLIQEFIKGNEFGVDIFNDMSGVFRGLVCKRKLAMRAGETEKATTVASTPFEISAKKISHAIHHIGNMDCDFLEKNGQYLLLELNPRFGGGYPFSHEAGGNLIRPLLLSLFNRNDEIEIKYEQGKTFAKCDTLVEAR